MSPLSEQKLTALTSLFPTESVELIHRRYDPADGVQHNHNDSDRYLIVLPYTAGSIRLERGDIVVHDGPVRPGMVRLAAPGDRSAITTLQPFESAMLWIPSTMIAGAAASLAATARDEAVLAAQQDVRRLCPPLISALELHGSRRELVVNGLATALLGLLLGHRPAAPRNGLDDDQYAAAVTFAEQRLRSGITLRDWASAVDMAAVDFSRCFREHTGVAPYAWFMDRRIDESMRLLATTDQPIVEIGLEMGFDSQSHFTDAFKRRAGMPPGRWRSARSATASVFA